MLQCARSSHSAMRRSVICGGRTVVNMINELYTAGRTPVTEYA